MTEPRIQPNRTARKARAAWQRPEVRRIQAKASEATVLDTNADFFFS
jgi:hypothetical protein